MGKKSLAEQIAALSKPQTDFDIEDSEIADGRFSGDENDSELEQSEDELKSEHYVKVSESGLRKKNNRIQLGGKYQGSKVSREALFDDEAEESGEDEEDEEGEDEEDDVNDEEEEEEEEDEEEEIEGYDSDSGASMRSNSESEDDEEDQEDDIKRSKLKNLLNQERKHIVNRLSQSTTTDAIKGYSILQQHKLFDSLIDSRLKVQKALTNSNLLPMSHEALKSEPLSTDKTHKLIKKSIDHCYDLLDTIANFRSKLLAKDNISTKTINPKKRSLSAYLESAQEYDSIVNLYRSSVLTKWSAKIQNSSGSTALNSGKFKAINQSAEQQVNNNLSDMERLVKRTKLNRRQVKPLALEYYLSTVAEASDESDGEPQNPDLPSEEKASSKNQTVELDTIFDDEDFYRVLLNDLVDKKIQSQNPANGLTIALRSAQKAHKLKKNIDTKASKGRKLRYHIQDQIANFETPHSGWKWSDDQIDEFFASLLGQKVNMKEDEDDDNEEEAEGEDEDLAIESDGIKLFA